jgi:hypothetical protein
VRCSDDDRVHFNRVDGNDGYGFDGHHHNRLGNHRDDREQS